MNLTRLSVRRPVTTLMVFLAVVLLGFVSFRQLPVQLLPDLTVPGLGVYLGKPESSPQEIMEELTRPAESIIAELPRVRGIRSWTGEWGTWIQVEFQPGTDIRFMTLDLQERLNVFQTGLEDRRTQVNVFPFSTSEFNNFLMELALEGPEGEAFLAELVEDRIEPALSAISGVARVEAGGVANEAAVVELDPVRLRGFDVDFAEVFRRIQSAGTEENYLGRLRVPGEDHFIYLQPAVRTVEDLRVLPIDAGGTIVLEDVATVDYGLATGRRLYRSNGRNAVGIRLDREEGANLIEVARQVRSRIDEVNAELPDGMRLVIQTDIAEIVESAIFELLRLALIGAALALFVPLFFFRSLRIAGIVFVSVPISVVAVFNLFYFAGMSLNVFSIIGLALGVGMLVDNSIVVVENCYRLHDRRGLAPLLAAEQGGAEVGKALLAATATTCVPFIALLFVEGEFALIVREPTLALVFPLMISLLIALTLSTMLASRALAVGGKAAVRPPSARQLQGRTSSRFRRVYRRILKGALRRRGVVMLIVAAVLVVIFFEACAAVRESTVSREQTSTVFRVHVRTPSGSTLAEASAAFGYVEERLAEHPDIERFGAWIRGNGGHVDVTLFESRERPSGRTLPQIRATIVDFIGDVPGAEVSLTSPDAPLDENPLQTAGLGLLEVRAMDAEPLDAYAERLAEAIRLLPEIDSARVQRERATPELQSQLVRERMQLFNIQAQTLGQYVGATRASGQISSLILRDGNRRTDVTVVIAGAEASTVDDVRRLQVYTGDGSTVRMEEISEFVAGTAPRARSRIDRMSAATIEYVPVPGVERSQVTRALRETIRSVPNPIAAVTEFGGQQAQLDERQRDFLFVLGIGLLFIYIVMAAVFESFWIPFTIILTNPLMLIGIVGALAITDLPFDELAAFGVILLNGLAVNNGIVLMDTAMRLQREKGLSRLRSIFQAADQRLRPIVMTFLTTTLGLLPLAMTGGAESQWRPVAVTVLGGLTTATILMLVVLPCIYMLGEDTVGSVRPYAARASRAIFGRLERWANGAVHFVFTLVRPWKWRLRPVLQAMLFPFRVVRRVVALAVRVVLFPIRLMRESLSDAGWFVKRDRAARHAGATTSTFIERTTAQPVVLEVRNLRVHFPLSRVPGRTREFEALKGIHLDIPPGLFGLIGPNGAGKTTLMRCVAGLLAPTRGSVMLDGSPMRAFGAAISPLIGYLPQVQGHYGWMTLREHLEFYALLHAEAATRSRLHPETPSAVRRRLAVMPDLTDPREREGAIRQAAEEVNLLDVLHERIATFSGGMRQRAGIARLLVASPPVLIVDEPTAGLDPIERMRLRILLAQLAHGRTLILSTHLVEDIEESCDAVAVLKQGSLAFAGSPDALRGRFSKSVWSLPFNGKPPEALQEEAAQAGGRLLFRYARAGEQGLRILSSQAPHADARPEAPTLEDALLALLQEEPR